MMKLDNLPDNFSLIGGDTTLAQIKYSGGEPKLHGENGIFDQALKATGAARIAPIAGYVGHEDGLTLELSATR